MAAIAKNTRLEGGELRTELRASITVDGTPTEHRLWRDTNEAAKSVVNAKVGWPPLRVAKHITRNRPAIADKAKKLAKPRGAKAIDIILEQAEFWCQYHRLPDTPWILFAQLYFGRRVGLEEAAYMADIDKDEANVVRLILDHQYSYRDVEAVIGVPKSTVGGIWHGFLEAVEGADEEGDLCHCDNPHCSLNSTEHRTWLARLIIGKWKAGIKSGVSGVGSAKVARGTATGHMQGSKGGVPQPADREYVATLVNDKLPVLCHRLVWTLERGRIPSEHEIHHVDGDALNNAICNLALLPKWTHRVIH